MTFSAVPCRFLYFIFYFKQLLTYFIFHFDILLIDQLFHHMMIITIYKILLISWDSI